MIESLANVKAYLHIPNAEEEVDDYLTSFCEQVDEIIKNFLSRDLETAEYTELYNGSGKDKLVLRQAPITEVTTIELWDGTEWDEITDSDYDRLYIVPRSNSFITEGYVFSKGDYNYQITYTAGYSDDDMPKSIKKAFNELVKIAYDNSPIKNNTLGKLSKVEGGNLVVNIDVKAQEKILDDIWSYRSLNV